MKLLHFHNLPEILTANKFLKHIFGGINFFLSRKMAIVLKCFTCIWKITVWHNDMFNWQKIISHPKLKLVTEIVIFDFQIILKLGKQLAMEWMRVAFFAFLAGENFSNVVFKEFLIIAKWLPVVASGQIAMVLLKFNVWKKCLLRSLFINARIQCGNFVSN